MEDIERFFLKILTDPEIKKVYFLMLDHNSYIIGMNIRKITKNIKEQQIKADGFFNLIKNEKISFNIIYEIRKY